SSRRYRVGTPYSHAATSAGSSPHTVVRSRSSSSASRSSGMWMRNGWRVKRAHLSTRPRVQWGALPCRGSDGPEDVMTVDLSSGLPDERDFIVRECPDIPMWSENLLFALYDPDADLAMWLHLGTVPGNWTMWEDRVLVMLPGHGGALSLRAYHHTAPERRPAGPGLEFRQREPWRRWHVRFDGYGLHAPEPASLAGGGPAGPPH